MTEEPSTSPSSHQYAYREFCSLGTCIGASLVIALTVWLSFTFGPHAYTLPMPMPDGPAPTPLPAFEFSVEDINEPPRYIPEWMFDMKLGTVRPFLTPESTESASIFNLGIRAMHCFFYDAAPFFFREVQKRDRSFVLAYVYEALSYKRFLWNYEDRDSAIGVLTRLDAQLPLIQMNSYEQNLVQAVFIVWAYQPANFNMTVAVNVSASVAQRELAFANHLRSVMNSNDDDMMSLLALQLLQFSNSDPAALSQARLLIQTIARRSPQHPGALHYAVHAFDMDNEALIRNYGLPYAQRFATVASDSPHALHMATHLYFRLSMVDAMIHWNAKSIYSSVALCLVLNQDPLACDAGNKWHSVEWLHYGLLLQYRFDEAAAVRQRVDQAVARSVNVPDLPQTQARMHLHNLAISRQFDQASAPLDVPTLVQLASRSDSPNAHWEVYSELSSLLMDGLQRLHSQQTEHVLIQALEASSSCHNALSAMQILTTATFNEALSRISTLEALSRDIPSPFDVFASAFVALELRVFSWIRIQTLIRQSPLCSIDPLSLSQFISTINATWTSLVDIETNMLNSESVPSLATFIPASESYARWLLDVYSISDFKSERTLQLVQHLLTSAQKRWPALPGPVFALAKLRVLSGDFNAARLMYQSALQQTRQNTEHADVVEARHFLGLDLVTDNSGLQLPYVLDEMLK